jgi:hypothetical protein
MDDRTQHRLANKRRVVDQLRNRVMGGSASADGPGQSGHHRRRGERRAAPLSPPIESVGVVVLLRWPGAIETFEEDADDITTMGTGAHPRPVVGEPSGLALLIKRTYPDDMG